MYSSSAVVATTRELPARHDGTSADLGEYAAGRARRSGGKGDFAGPFDTLEIPATSRRTEERVAGVARERKIKKETAPRVRLQLGK